MRLKDYAKKMGITYQTAWNWYKAGNLPNAYKSKSGSVFVDLEEKVDKKEYTVVYCRVSSSENKGNLATQSKRVQDFCSAKGWVVDEIVEEIGSGLNDDRRKLQSLFNNPKITRVVVEHKDRLSRFGFNYLKTLWKVDIVVINNVDTDEQDLMQDFVSLVTSFCARLYGKRRAKRNTEKLIKELNKEY